MTPIERVRSALTYAAHEAPNDYWRERYNETLRELEGMVIVPVEPTREMLNAAVDVDSYKLDDISPLGFRISPQRLFEKCYAAMIAPYVKGE